MAKLKPDFRKTLRAQAGKVQEDNLRRLLAGETVRGGAVAPRKAQAGRSKGRARRVRILGLRVSVRELEGRVGVRTSEMLKDVTRKGNVKVGRVSFKIIPSSAQILKWRVFNAGRRGKKPQAARPVSGISTERLEEARAEITRDARRQFVSALRGRGD